MVSQNMSGNKKGAAAGGGGGGGGPVIGLKFNTTNATSGVAFSNSDTTATNSSGGAIASAKANAGIIPNTTNYWYWEFTVGTANSMFMGVGLPTFVCDAANRVGIIANSVAYRPDNGILQAAGATLTTVSSARVGDVIGFKLEVFNPGSSLTVIKNGTVLINQIDISAYVTDNSVAWTPIFSANVTTASATISNNIYSYAGYTPIGTSATIVGASASVPAVADGAYDVYTFNASGTFTAASTGAVRALVIAGGGGGNTGTNTGGGGGAGGYLENGVTVTPQTYTVTVGAGGSSGASGTASSIGSAISTVGGGGLNSTGGSGAGRSVVTYGPSLQAGFAGTAGQGNAGGGGFNNGAGNAGGGGGGKGGNGADSDSSGLGLGGNGGAGLASTITGTSISLGGGGGGGGSTSGGTATAGGGNGGYFSGGFIAPISGTTNTGGGGGGGYTTSNGGSGVVIIRVRARA